MASPPASHADPGSPLWKIIYTVLRVSHSLWFPEHNTAEQWWAPEKHFSCFSQKLAESCDQLLIFFFYVFINTVSILLKSKSFFPRNLQTTWKLAQYDIDLGCCIPVFILFIKKHQIVVSPAPTWFLCIYKIPLDTCWCWVVRCPGRKATGCRQFVVGTSCRVTRPGQSPPSPAELHAHPHGEEPWPSRPDLAWPPCPDQRQSNVPTTP